MRAAARVCELANHAVARIGAHETNKRVYVVDQKIAVFRWISFVIIICYTIGYEVIYKRGYIEYYDVEGNWHMYMHHPSVEADRSTKCDFMYSDQTCIDDFSPRSSLPYCCDETCTSVSTNMRTAGGVCNGKSERHQRCYQCRWADHAQVVHAFDRSLVISSFERQQDQRMNDTCIHGDTCRAIWRTENVTQFYVADFERFTVALDHFVEQKALDIHSTMRYMKGVLRVTGTKPPQQALCRRRANTDAPCEIEPVKSRSYPYDTFMLGDLVSAAGIGDLANMRFDTSKVAAREAGLVLDFAISYSNDSPWRSLDRDITYSYEVSALRRDNYQLTKEQYIDYPTVRRVRFIHGIRLAGRQEGRLSRLSFSNLFLRLIICVQLIKMLRWGTNYYLSHCSSEAKFLKAYVRDFFSLKSARKLSGADMEEVHDMLRVRGLQPHGKMERQIGALVVDECSEYADLKKQEVRSYITSSFTSSIGNSFSRS